MVELIGDLPIKFLCENTSYREGKTYGYFYELIEKCEWKFKTRAIDRKARQLVTYYIYVTSTNPIPPISTYECHGDKCRREVDRSANHWCVSCHVSPWEYNNSGRPHPVYDLYMSCRQSLSTMRDLTTSPYLTISRIEEVKRKTIPKDVYEEDKKKVLALEQERLLKWEEVKKIIKELNVEPYVYAGFNSAEEYQAYLA